MNDREAAGPDTGEEPDYRFTLANERTFLAWIRTALALLAGSVAIVQLVPQFGFSGAKHALGALLAVMGVAVAVAATLRWRAVQRAMRQGHDLPRSRMPMLLAAGLTLLSVLVVVLLILGHNG